MSHALFLEHLLKSTKERVLRINDLSKVLDWHEINRQNLTVHPYTCHEELYSKKKPYQGKRAKV